MLSLLQRGMDMKKLLVGFSLYGLLAILPHTLHALPVGWSTATFNDMTVIIDPTNNLQWLSPVYSTNISCNDMLLNLSDTNSIYYGFRYASSLEVIALYEAYGLIPNTTVWPPPAANHQPALEFQQDFGITRVLAGNQLNTLGILSNSAYEGTWHYAGEVTIFLDLFNQAVQDGAVANTQAGIASDAAVEGWGSYLVKPISAQIRITEILVSAINLKSKGLTPVAVLSTDGFDAVSLDPSRVTFALAAPVNHSFEDVDGDGDVDLAMHFTTQDLQLDPADTEAVLIGQTGTGVLVEGTVSVKIVF